MTLFDKVVIVAVFAIMGIAIRGTAQANESEIITLEEFVEEICSMDPGPISITVNGVKYICAEEKKNEEKI